MAKRRPNQQVRTTRRRTTSATPPHTSDKKRQTAREAGFAFQQLVDTMQRLRTECPWDREQTLQTLRSFVLQETYEVLQAIDREDHDALRGEIGDFLLEAVFLAQIEADEGRFTITESVRAITEKLIRRHPHVFGSKSGIRTPAQVHEQWEAIKAREQKASGERKAVLGGLPKALPALLGAHEIGTRVAAVGFDWEHAEDVVAKIKEEVAELERAVHGEGRERIEEEMGDLLFSIANLARKLGVEPESALRNANQKFADRFDKLERHLEANGRSVHDANIGQMEEAWEQIKHAD
jgi:MazG family protein